MKFLLLTSETVIYRNQEKVEEEEKEKRRSRGKSSKRKRKNSRRWNKKRRRRRKKRDYGYAGPRRSTGLVLLRVQFLNSAFLCFFLPIFLSFVLPQQTVTGNDGGSSGRPETSKTAAKSGALYFSAALVSTTEDQGA